jgi:hypothetical protein
MTAILKGAALDVWRVRGQIAGMAIAMLIWRLWNG